MRWIRFEFNGSTGKTKWWLVLTNDAHPVKLGTVKWFGRWRQYGFFPEPNTVYERQCLRDIADFCETKTQAQRDAARARAASDRNDSG